MNCEKYRVLFSDFIDDKLSKDKIKDFRNHIETCSLCKSEFCSFMQTQKILGFIPEKKASSDLWSGIEARIKKTEERKFIFLSKSFGISGNFSKGRSPIIRIYGTSYGIAKRG